MSIKAYATIASPESHLHQIHAGCGQRISYQKVCPEHGELTGDQIQKAFAYSPTLLLALSQEELNHLEPDNDKNIDIKKVFAPDELDLKLLAGRSLFLAPANLAAQRAYDVFAATLHRKRRWALACTVLSQKRQRVVIHSDGETLVLHTLHDPSQCRAELPRQAAVSKPTRSESRRLVQLMAECDGEVDWHEFHDDSHEKLAALVANKLESQKGEGTKKLPAKKRSKKRRPARAPAATKAA